MLGDSLLRIPGNDFVHRYSILKQRIARHELLNSGSESSSQINRQNDIKLHDIDYLQSRTSQQFKTVVFGYLSQLKEGKYFLEDPTGVLPLDLSNAVSFFYSVSYIL